MCGRYVMSRTDGEVAALYGAEVVGDPTRPSWNVAPQQSVKVVLERSPAAVGQQADADQADEPRRQLRTVRWGLVPSWPRTPRSATSW